MIFLAHPARLSRHSMVQMSTSPHAEAMLPAAASPLLLQLLAFQEAARTSENGAERSSAGHTLSASVSPLSSGSGSGSGSGAELAPARSGERQARAALGPSFPSALYSPAGKKKRSAPPSELTPSPPSSSLPLAAGLALGGVAPPFMATNCGSAPNKMTLSVHSSSSSGDTRSRVLPNVLPSMHTHRRADRHRKTHTTQSQLSELCVAANNSSPAHAHTQPTPLPPPAGCSRTHLRKRAHSSLQPRMEWPILSTTTPLRCLTSLAKLQTNSAVRH